MITLHGEMVDAGIYRNNMLWRSLVQRLLPALAVSKFPLSSGLHVATVGRKIMSSLETLQAQ